MGCWTQAREEEHLCVYERGVEATHSGVGVSVCRTEDSILISLHLFRSLFISFSNVLCFSLWNTYIYMFYIYVYTHIYVCVRIYMYIYLFYIFVHSPAKFYFLCYFEYNHFYSFIFELFIFCILEYNLVLFCYFVFCNLTKLIF